MEDALKGTSTKNEETIEKDLLDELLSHSSFDTEPDIIKKDDDLAPDTAIINLFEVDERAEKEAQDIINRLSGYYFNPKYIEEHPYIPNKIAQEMNNIRRLLKMLAVNEKAQDSLILNITGHSGKGTLYQSLTALQNTTLSIQTQLNKVTGEIENIFKEMQDNCEKTFEEKDKEIDPDINKKIVRGSKEFIMELIQRGANKIQQEDKEKNESKQLDLFG